MQAAAKTLLYTVHTFTTVLYRLWRCETLPLLYLVCNIHLYVSLKISNIYLAQCLGSFLEFPGWEAGHFVFANCGHVVMKVTTLFSYYGNPEPVREMREVVRESESR